LEKPEEVDLKLADFDGVKYHLSTPESKNVLKLSMQMNCYQHISKYGTEEYLRQHYGAFLTSPEVGYDVTLQFDLRQLPENEEEKKNLVRNIALLKRHTLASVFEQCFLEQERGEVGPLKTIRYRDGIDEAIWVQAQKDRVTVIFSTMFKDETDIIFGKVFLQEFVDARKQLGLQNTPQVLYSREPPVELRDETSLTRGDHMGYVTFILFPRHFGEKSRREATITLIQTFRNYLHYHIKCTKAYMHTRMRAKVSELLKILNRAKPDVIVEKKTAT
jgi:actin related protein 2/3 complex, subunit 2